MIFNNYFIALNLHLEYFKRMFHVSKHLQGDRFLWSARLVQLSVQLSVQLMHGNPNFLHLNQSKTGSDWQLTYLRIVCVSTCKWAVKLGRLKVDQEIPINSSVRQVTKSYNELATHSLLGEVPCHYDRQHKGLYSTQFYCITWSTALKMTWNPKTKGTNISLFSLSQTGPCCLVSI